MAEDLAHDELVRRQRAIRALSDDDRAAAIAASPNVIGFERMSQHAHQVQMSESYRRGTTEKSA